MLCSNRHYQKGSDIILFSYKILVAEEKDRVGPSGHQILSSGRTQRQGPEREEGETRAPKQRDIHARLCASAGSLPPWSRVEGESQANLPQVPPSRWHLYGCWLMKPSIYPWVASRAFEEKEWGASQRERVSFLNAERDFWFRNQLQPGLRA